MNKDHHFTYSDPVHQRVARKYLDDLRSCSASALNALTAHLRSANLVPALSQINGVICQKKADSQYVGRDFCVACDTEIVVSYKAPHGNFGSISIIAERRAEEAPPQKPEPKGGPDYKTLLEETLSHLENMYGSGGAFSNEETERFLANVKSKFRNLAEEG